MPGDNAWSESFFANLKKEAVHWTHFVTREEAREAMFEHIEGFYNTHRVRKSVDFPSPYTRKYGMITKLQPLKR